MRRLLRDVAENRELGDVTTLTDSTVMDLIQTQAARRAQRGLTASRRRRPPRPTDEAAALPPAREERGAPLLGKLDKTTRP